MSKFINNARYSNVVIGRTPKRRLDPLFLPRLSGTRSGLLLTTALATGLVIGVGMAPRPAMALVTCTTPGPNAGVYRYYSVDDDIRCITTPDYTNPAGTTLDFRTHTSDDNDIYVNNSGTLSPANNGIYTFTGTNLSDIKIKNSGDIHAGGDGIVSVVNGYDSNVHIYNYDNIYATAAGGDGFNVVAGGYSDDIFITNTGKLDVGGYGFGVGAQQGGSSVTITNSGDVRARTDGFHVYTLGDHSDITITNNGEKLIAGDDGFYAGTAYDNSDITIKNHAAIETMATGNGIEAFVQGYRSAVEIHNYNSIKTVSGDGIHAEVGNYPGHTYLNDITITNTGDFNVGGHGIAAFVYYGGSSPIDINNSGHITSYQDGIHAITSVDKSPIKIANTGNITSSQNGIWARTYGPNSGITINTTDDINATGYNGIDARAFGYQSGVDITFSGAITAYRDAIYAYAKYNDVNVNHTGNLTSTDGGSGVHAYSKYGQVDVVVHGNISAIDVGYGIWAHAENGPVYVHAFGNIDSAQNAIRGAAPGKVDIFHYDGHLISTDNGVNAVTGRSYQDHVAIHNHGDVEANGHGLAAYAYTDANVYQFGNINAHYAYRSGIAATSRQGNIEIYLNGNITAFYDGIHAFAYNGDVYVHTPGNIDAGHKGIYAYAEHSAVVVHNGDISLDTSHPGSSEQAVDVHAVTGAASVTLDNGSVHGITAGVRIDAAVDAYLTIGPNGSLTSDNDLAVQMTGAANANVYISGYVRGYMQFDTDDDVYVQDDGTWRPTGTTDFDFFGGGGTDRVFNGGVIRTSDFGAPSTERVYFDNLEQFYNGSTTGGPGLITMVNNVVGDQLNLNYNFGAGNIEFHGVGNSNLAVDTFLSGASANATDQLFIYGDTDGNTLVHVNNTNPNGSSPNYNGIPVVIVSGTTSESDFDLADAPLQAGFWSWDLQLDPDSFNQNLCTPCDVHELITIGPSSLGTALAVNITTAQEIWHETTGAWADRQADLRLQLMDGAATTTADLGDGGGMMSDEGAPSGNGNVTPGVWAKGIGVWAERDADYTIAGPPPTTFNLDHDINIKGVLGGVDFGTDATPGDAILFGLLGGYTWSNLDFDAGGGSKFEGPSVGGYGTFIHGGFYADAVVKADFLDVSIDATPFGQNGSASSNVTNVGGRLESGYKLGSRFFVEPQGSVSYMNTQFDDISLLGGQVSFNEDESLRGRAGARIGAAFGDANFSIQPDVGASVWHEFMGDNSVDVTGFSFALPTFSDSRDDTWGEVSGGISAVSASGWSVFARGKWEFADDFQALSVHGGARIAW